MAPTAQMASKIDPQLLLAFERAAGSAASVFLRLVDEPDKAQARYLEARGIRVVPGSRVLTGSVNRMQAKELADQAWVKSLSAATRMKKKMHRF